MMRRELLDWVGTALAAAGIVLLGILAFLGATSSFPAPSEARADVASRGGAAEPALLSPAAAEPTAEFLAWERDRIRGHLARVEREMLERDVSELSPEQRERRARNLEHLARYRERGIFPRNRDFPGELVPYFVDEEGVRCAVGYLLFRTGREDLVREVAATRNHARVPELADEPELVEWLEEEGLSLEEAAAIQPMYCGGFGFSCPEPPPPAAAGRLTTGYVAAGAASGILQGVGIGLSLTGSEGAPSGLRGAFTLAAAGTGVGLGAHGLAEGGDMRTVGFVHLGVGVLTGVLGVRGLRHAMGTASSGEEERRESRSRAAASTLPAVEVSPMLSERVGGTRAPGLVLRVSY